MTHIIIKNVGPIKDVEFDLNKINVFMGPQSSGKSTIAKIISYCSWYEKNCILVSKPQKDFYGELLEYHNMEDSYFSDDSYIEYKSDNCHIVFVGSDKNNVEIKTFVSQDNIFKNEKIEYIPAERNVVAISGIGEYNKAHNNVLGFLYEWFDAKREKKKDFEFELPLRTLNGVSYYYTQEDDADHLILVNGKEIKLQHSSSGLISATPLIVVFEYVTKGVYLKKRLKSPFEIINIRARLDDFDEKLKGTISDIIYKMDATKADLERLKEKNKAIKLDNHDNSSEEDEIASIESKIDSMQKLLNRSMGFDSDYNYSKIIIEEPELNLFPNTQQELVYYMLTVLNSEKRDHKLVITTHSPYILFSLNNCMMGGLVKKSIPEEEQNSFASRDAWIDPKKVSIYEIHNGKLQSIQDEDGIIEDNYLNKAYKENSAEYMSLLNYYGNEE